MANDFIVTYCYQRITRGFGDMIMLRPCIVGNIHKFPNARHILHCLKSTSALVRDIVGLEIIEFDDSILGRSFDMQVYQRLLAESASLVSKYGSDVKVYELITECAYESENAPYVIENGKYVSTGKKIMLSRQALWCDQVGVSFDMDNYNVHFFDSELDYADSVMSKFQYEPMLMIHLKSADAWRSYKYPDSFIDYFAKRWDGLVVALDHEYKGIRKNVIMLNEKDIRKVWCLISKAHLLVGVDSFGIHASGSVNVQTYGIFGPTDPDTRLEYHKATSCGAYLKCDYQYCWYQNCKYVPCMNARTPKWYWNDIERKGLLNDNRDYFNGEQRVIKRWQELAV
jgi:hypothetical protein